MLASDMAGRQQVFDHGSTIRSSVIERRLREREIEEERKQAAEAERQRRRHAGDGIEVGGPRDHDDDEGTSSQVGDGVSVHHGHDASSADSGPGSRVSARDGGDKEGVSPRTTAQSKGGLLDADMSSFRGLSASRVLDIFPETVLWGLERTNPARKACIKLVVHPWFQRGIILLILLNCVFLAMYDPLNPSGTTLSEVVDAAEVVFTVLFTIEAMIKITAQGLIRHKDAYLRSGWNWLDFIVVVMGYVSFVPGVGNMSSLRTLRILRPLRTLTTVPGMRVIVNSMLSSLPALVNVALMSAFFFFIFGIVGVQLWAGVMRGRCFVDGEVDESDERLCALPCTAEFFPSEHPACPPTFGRNCEPAFRSSGLKLRECRPAENPGNGFINFDNIGAAMLTIFTAITLEGWADTMYGVMESFGLHFITVPYFILLIMFGSFFLLNLTLAVIWDEYQKAEQEVREREEALVRELLEREGLLDGDEPPDPAVLKRLSGAASTVLVLNSVKRSIRRLQSKRGSDVKDDDGGDGGGGDGGDGDGGNGDSGGAGVSRRGPVPLFSSQSSRALSRHNSSAGVEGATSSGDRTNDGQQEQQDHLHGEAGGGRESATDVARRASGLPSDLDADPGPSAKAQHSGSRPRSAADEPPVAGTPEVALGAGIDTAAASPAAAAAVEAACTEAGAEEPISPRLAVGGRRSAMPEASASPPVPGVPVGATPPRAGLLPPITAHHVPLGRSLSSPDTARPLGASLLGRQRGGSRHAEAPGLSPDGSEGSGGGEEEEELQRQSQRRRKRRVEQDGEHAQGRGEEVRKEDEAERDGEEKEGETGWQRNRHQRRHRSQSPAAVSDGVGSVASAKGGEAAAGEDEAGAVAAAKDDSLGAESTGRAARGGAAMLPATLGVSVRGPARAPPGASAAVPDSARSGESKDSAPADGEAGRAGQRGGKDEEGEDAGEDDPAARRSHPQVPQLALQPKPALPGDGMEAAGGRVQSSAENQRKLEQLLSGRTPESAQLRAAIMSARLQTSADSGPRNKMGCSSTVGGSQQLLCTRIAEEERQRREEHEAELGYGPVPRLAPLVESLPFRMFIIVLIVLNTGTLGAVHYGMSESFEHALEVLNYVFTAVFTLEVVLKLLALGRRRYVDDRLNVFDAVVVFFSLLEIVLAMAGVSSSSGLSALRAFRLLRVFKLARSWRSLRELLATITRSLVDVGNASIVLGIVVFIFTLLGMQLFGGKFTEKQTVTVALPSGQVTSVTRGVFDEKPRAHFDNFFWAMITVFQVLTAEDWDAVLHDAMFATSTAVAVIYFVLLNVVGTFVILNLFLAILLGNFENSREPEAEAGADGAPRPGTVIPAAAQVALAREGEEEDADAEVLEGGDAGLQMPQLAAQMAVTQGAGVAEHNGAGQKSASVASRPFREMPPLAPCGEAKPVDGFRWGSAATTESGGVEEGEQVDGWPKARRTPRSGAAAAQQMQSVVVVAETEAEAEGSVDGALVEPAGRGEAGKLGPELGRGGERVSPLPPRSSTSHSVPVAMAPKALPAASSVAVALASRLPSNDGNSSITVSGGSSPLARRKSSRGDREIVVTGKSLYLFPVGHPVRAAVARLVRHRHFDNFILLLIVFSSVLLALDEPGMEDCDGSTDADDNSCEVFTRLLHFADIVLVVLFGLEMVLKVVAMGFVIGPHAYLRNGWNVLDFVIVVVSTVSVSTSGNESLQSLRALRALRGFRPLRTVSRFPGLRLVVNSIFRSLPAVGSAVLVNALFLLIFGIIGMQNWLGALNMCNDPSVSTKAECVGMFDLTDDACEALATESLEDACRMSNGTAFPREWGSTPQHFNHLGAAVLTVFEVASGELWPDIMHMTVDAVGKDKPQERDHNPAAALFFVGIGIVCNFLMFNVFVGIVIDQFSRMRAESDGSALLTEQQKLWVEQTRLMLQSRPPRRLPPPHHPVRLRCYRFVTHGAFEPVIMAMIVLNTVFMASRHFGQPDYWATTLEVLNVVFGSLFAVEAALKLVAFGVRGYFSRGWNRFDFFVVVSTFAGLSVPGSASQFAALLRIVRVARIFRLVRTSPGLLNLFKTLVSSLPSLVNVGAVMLLVFFVFAVLGMNLFGGLRYGEFLNEQANFDSFLMAMLTLFRMATGENYNGIMHDCRIQPPYCDANDANNCGHTLLAPLYFVSFQIVTTLGLLNLLIAIIIDNFSDTVALSEATITEDHIESFKEAWALYDPDVDFLIPNSDLLHVVKHVKYPLGVANTPGVLHASALARHALHIIADADIPVRPDGMIHYQDTLLGLANRVNGDMARSLPDSVLQEVSKLRKRSRGKWCVEYRMLEVVAATAIQTVYRGHRVRRKDDVATFRASLQSARREEAQRAQGHQPEVGQSSRSDRSR